MKEQPLLGVLRHLPILLLLVLRIPHLLGKNPFLRVVRLLGLGPNRRREVLPLPAVPPVLKEPPLLEHPAFQGKPHLLAGVPILALLAWPKLALVPRPGMLQPVPPSRNRLPPPANRIPLLPKPAPRQVNRRKRRPNRLPQPSSPLLFPRLPPLNQALLRSRPRRTRLLPGLRKGRFGW